MRTFRKTVSYVQLLTRGFDFEGISSWVEGFPTAGGASPQRQTASSSGLVSPFGHRLVTGGVPVSIELLNDSDPE